MQTTPEYPDPGPDATFGVTREESTAELLGFCDEFFRCHASATGRPAILWLGTQTTRSTKPASIPHPCAGVFG